MGLLNTNIWQDHDSELARISYSARMLYLLRGAICLDRMELAKRLGVTWPTASIPQRNYKKSAHYVPSHKRLYQKLEVEKVVIP